MKRSILSIFVRSCLSLIAAWVLFATWHEQLGRFMFFEQLDPPAADPHRTQHLRDAYFLIYGIIGLVLGIIATVSAPFRSALVTVVVCITAFLTARYRGVPDLLNPLSEEGYFGAPAFLLSATATSGAIVLVRNIRQKRLSRKARKAGQCAKA